MNSKGTRQGASHNPLPDPLQSGGWSARLGTLAPPSVSLSFASAAVAVSVFGFLQRNADLRGLFKIAFTDNPAIDHGIRLGAGLFAALLAWAIVLRCRRRPGPLWPRFWALGLALLASGLAAVQSFNLWPGHEPLLDAATLACLAAALALWPRLLRLRPDSRLIQSIAPLSLLLVLAAVLPGLYFMGGDVVAVWKHGLTSAIGDLRKTSQDLRRCGETGQGCSKPEFRAGLEALESVADTSSWREAAAKVEGNPALEQSHGELLAAEDGLLGGLAAELTKGLARQIEAVLDNKPRQGLDSIAAFKSLLPVAAKLGKLERLRPAYASMADTLIHAPRPTLNEPPVIYTSSVTENGPWDVNLAFADAGRLAVGQHQLLKKLFMDLGNVVDGDDPELKPLKDDFLNKHQQGWNQRMQAMEDDFALHWLLPFLQESPLQADTPIPAPPLQTVLGMRLMGGLAASDIPWLLNLSRQEADKLYKEHRAAGCEKIQKDRIYRLDCRSYRATAKDTLALRVELRVIYDLHKNPDKPDRLFFLFPLPAERNLENLAMELEHALPEARSALQRLLDVLELQKILQTEGGGGQAFPPLCPPSVGSACAEGFEFIKGSEQEYLKLVIYRH